MSTRRRYFRLTVWKGGRGGGDWLWTLRGLNGRVINNSAPESFQKRTNCFRNFEVISGVRLFGKPARDRRTQYNFVATREQWAARLMHRSYSLVEIGAST